MDSDEAYWDQLDPIFILGRQRTGTSIMWRALQVANFVGFPEDHLWYDLIKAFAWWRDPAYKSHHRLDHFAMGAGRNFLLEKQVALVLDRFHRDQLPSELGRWVSKSPGVDPIAVAPMLAEIFPKAQFIFTLRNPVTTVDSAVAYMLRHFAESDVDSVFRGTCENWVRVMETWRWVRPLLAGRYIEVVQEHIVVEPDLVARQVMAFLDAPQWAEAVVSVFRSTRENSAFPEKPVSDFMYAVDWTDAQKALLTDICASEMAVWGYRLDVQHPGEPESPYADPVEPPFASLDSYYRWMQETYEAGQLWEQSTELWRELQYYKDLLAQVSQGRVMRLMNGFNRWRERLFRGNKRS